MTIPRKKYTTKSKLRAVKLVVDDGFTLKDAAKKTGCAISTLKKWIKLLKEEQLGIKPESTLMTAEQLEIIQLKKFIELNKLDSVTKEVLKTYSFQLVLSGVNIHTPNLEDSLFEAGCDDGLLCSYNQTVYITFMRESSSFEDAVLSAINNIESCSLNVEVIYVDYDGYADSVHLSDIATLSDISRHIVQYYKDSTKEKRGFLMSIERVLEKHQVWKLDDVSPTLAVQGKIEVELADKIVITKALNEALEIRSSKPQVKNLLSKLSDSTV
jgi:transposase-like protein